MPSRKLATRASPPVRFVISSASKPCESAWMPWQLKQTVVKIAAPGVSTNTGAVAAGATSIHCGRAAPASGRRRDVVKLQPGRVVSQSPNGNVCVRAARVAASSLTACSAVMTLVRSSAAPSVR